MKIIIKPSPDTQHEVEVELMPSVGHAFIFDGMWYRAIDIIWNKVEPKAGDAAGVIKYKPTILLYSQPYVKEQKQSYNENYKG